MVKEERKMENSHLFGKIEDDSGHSRRPDHYSKSTASHAQRRLDTPPIYHDALLSLCSTALS